MLLYNQTTNSNDNVTHTKKRGGEQHEQGAYISFSGKEEGV